jgi:hypothetical protein
MYYGLQNLCFDVTTSANRSTAYAFTSKGRLSPGMENAGSIFAISAETGKRCGATISAPA